MLNNFQGLSKLQKIVQKSKGALPYLSCKALTKINLSKFVVVAAPDRANVPTSKKDVTAQPNFIQTH